MTFIFNICFWLMHLRCVFVSASFTSGHLKYLAWQPFLEYHHHQRYCFWYCLGRLCDFSILSATKINSAFVISFATKVTTFAIAISSLSSEVFSFFLNSEELFFVHFAIRQKWKMTRGHLCREFESLLKNYFCNQHDSNKWMKSNFLVLSALLQNIAFIE